jgi:hypothetical protein
MSEQESLKKPAFHSRHYPLLVYRERHGRVFPEIWNEDAAGIQSQVAIPVLAKHEITQEEADEGFTILEVRYPPPKLVPEPKIPLEPSNAKTQDSAGAGAEPGGDL